MQKNQELHDLMQDFHQEIDSTFSQNFKMSNSSDKNLRLHHPNCLDSKSIKLLLSVGQIPFTPIECDELILEIPQKKKWPKLPNDRVHGYQFIMEYLCLKYEIAGIWPSDPLNRVHMA
jgi:hypothetical protein